MNAMLITRVEPGEPVDIALGDLVPLLIDEVGNRWGLHGARLFWRLDPAAVHPLLYEGPDTLVVRGEPVGVAPLAHAGALALLHYHPSPMSGIYDLVCHGLAGDIARRVTRQPLEAPSTESLSLACALLRHDGDLALRLRTLGDDPPHVSAVAPLVFDQQIPLWLRRRVGQAARVADDTYSLSVRREAGLWRWLTSRRFADLWPEVLRVAGGPRQVSRHLG